MVFVPALCLTAGELSLLLCAGELFLLPYAGELSLLVCLLGSKISNFGSLPRDLLPIVVRYYLSTATAFKSEVDEN
jgi:hypothetical protein